MRRDLTEDTFATSPRDVLPRDRTDEADEELPERADFAVDSFGSVLIHRGAQRVVIPAEDVQRLKDFLIHSSPIWRQRR